MKTRTVTITVPVIPLPSWWTVTRWCVWLIAVTIAKLILEPIGLLSFLAVISIIGIGAAVLTHD